MTPEDFAIKLILDFIESNRGQYPSDDTLKEIKRLTDFVFSGE